MRKSDCSFLFLLPRFTGVGKHRALPFSLKRYSRLSMGGGMYGIRSDMILEAVQQIGYSAVVFVGCRCSFLVRFRRCRIQFETTLLLCALGMCVLWEWDLDHFVHLFLLGRLLMECLNNGVFCRLCALKDEGCYRRGAV